MLRVDVLHTHHINLSTHFCMCMILYYPNRHGFCDLARAFCIASASRRLSPSSRATGAPLYPLPFCIASASVVFMADLIICIRLASSISFGVFILSACDSHTGILARLRSYLTLAATTGPLTFAILTLACVSSCRAIVS